MYDLVIRAGNAQCPYTLQSGPLYIGVSGGCIASISRECPGEGRTTLDWRVGIVTPGFTDFHAHPMTTGSKYGVDPDLYLLPQGTVRVLCQGDAGARNWTLFRDETVGPSKCRVHLALNLSRSGESHLGPTFEQLEWADVAECVSAVEEIRRDGCVELWGLAVNTSRASCGDTDPRAVLERALLAADATALPLLVGMRRSHDWSYEDQIAALRPGDVATYCFSPGDEGIVVSGRVRRGARDARDRGVLFDLGHGAGSFSFDIAECAVGEGFLPDTLSTDFYRAHTNRQPPHGLPSVISAMACLGVPMSEILDRVTRRPDRLLRGAAAPTAGLRVGAPADLCRLLPSAEPEELLDTLSSVRMGIRWRASDVLWAGVPVESRL